MCMHMLRDTIMETNFIACVNTCLKRKEPSSHATEDAKGKP